MIYISESNNEYIKYTISEDSNEFQEVSRLEMNKGYGDQEQIDSDEVMAKMDSEKTFSLALFRKILQGQSI